jgi:hypothetical protein
MTMEKIFTTHKAPPILANKEVFQEAMGHLFEFEEIARWIDLTMGDFDSDSESPYTIIVFKDGKIALLCCNYSSPENFGLSNFMLSEAGWNIVWNREDTLKYRF